jgi:MoaA/NifB/PqqE/SkfB family radical SAM enzyme
MNNKPIPGIANMGVTDKCNCNCEHCSFFGAMDKVKEKKLLSNEEMKKIINECIDLGVTVINFVGGEPLIRADICDLIAHIDKDKAVSSLFTNGWFLKEKARELKKAGLMQVNVSIDSTMLEVHDRFRGKEGLFRKAIEGIKECQKVGLLTCISTTVTQEKLLNGDFEKLIILAKNLKVNEILVFDMLSAGMYSHVYPKKDKIDLELLNKIIRKYNSKPDFPGIVSYSFIRARFGCSAGRNYFYISPYGNIHPCDFSSGSFGNLRKSSLREIWDKLVEARNKIEYFNSNCKFCK